MAPRRAIHPQELGHGVEFDDLVGHVMELPVALDADDDRAEDGDVKAAPGLVAGGPPVIGDALGASDGDGDAPVD